MIKFELWLTLLLCVCCGPWGWSDDWQRDGLVQQKFIIQGTGDRNNPLRKRLDEAFTADELFIRFRIKYAAHGLDLPGEGNGEFFVLWLDQFEGHASSTHSTHVPNIGLHVDGAENRFMVRFESKGERFGPKLEGDREYLVAGRLWKSQSRADQSFDNLDMWVDPQPGDKQTPIATAHDSRALSSVSWIGFSTGRKTELNDKIEISDIATAATWEELLGLPPVMEEEVPIEKTVSFRSDIYPLLKQNCFECHAGSDSESGIRLDDFDEVLNQTSPRDAQASRLHQLILKGEMPPGKSRLKPAEVAVIAAWINEGLEWDESLLPSQRSRSDHWAFQPLRRPAVPKVQNPGWVQTPVDAFVQARQATAGVTPNPPADERTFQRRMSLDLLGLPPTAIDKQKPLSVDALLSNPAYGERWGRHWLDVARWGESNGHQHNRDRPYAWKYRDWVVDAFNRQLPFDQFLRDQIAGDEVTPYAPEHLVATGFLAAARYSGNELDKEIQRNDILVDVTNTTVSAFLGLTMGCAQCHSHKFDPISIRDYYRMQAYFTRGQPGNIVLQPDEHAEQLVEERWNIFDSVHSRLVQAKRKQGHPEPIYVIPKSVVARMNPAEKQRFQELEQQIAKLNQAWAYYTPNTAAAPLTVAPHEMRWPLPRNPSALANLETSILIRGDVQSKGPVVQPGWPLVFGHSESIAHSEPPRLQLADWMTRREHPLTARVWVNRIWQWHFGRGLVETSNDYGLQGTPPSHPDLLDYLASELIDHDWSTPHIHRLIMNSSTYQLSSDYASANAAIDPENKLLWRWVPRRLEAEAIRDSLLSISGQLELQRGGPSVSASSNRRSLYLKQKRDALPAQQMLFDGADAINSCTRRRVSTSPLQPLWLLNSDFMQQAATALAQRVESVDEAFVLALHRAPTQSERVRLQQLAEEFGLESACLAIFNSNEFVYLP